MSADVSRRPAPISTGWLPWRRPLPALALAFLVLLAACSSPEEKEAQHRERGIELFEEGDHAKAMIEFRNALRIDPKNADSLFYVGRIHEEAERWPQAFAAFQAAAAERPGFKDANTSLATIGLMGGRVEAAQKAVADLLEHHPGDAEGLTLDAALLLRKGDIQRAKDIANRVLREDPRHENAIAVLVGAERARQRPQDALAIVDEALTRLPESTSLRLLKVILLEEQGDAQAVKAVFDELFALEPDNVDYRLALANFHNRQNDLGSAESVLREALDQGVGDDTMGQALIHLVYRDDGIDAAEREVRTLLERDPDAHPLRFILSDFYVRENDLDAAEAILNEIVELAEEDEVLHDGKAALARIRLSRDDYEGARALTEEVIEGNARHRGGSFVLSLIHLEEGRLDDAIRVARSALRRDPNWVPALKVVAESHRRKGETDLAIGTLNDIMAQQPDSPAVAQTLARLLTERGDFDAAVKVWDDMIAAGRAAGRAHQARAQLRIRQGNWSAAQTDIEALLGTPGAELSGTLLAGDLMMAQSRFEESRDLFDRALEMSPQAPQPMIGTVRSFMAQDDLDGARAFLAARTESQPEDALAHNMLGELLVRRDEHAEAEQAFRRAIELQPDWVIPYRQLGALLRSDSRVDEAVATYEAGLALRPDATILAMDLSTALMEAERFDRAIEAYERVLSTDAGNEIAMNNLAALIADHRNDDPDELDRALALAQRFRTSDNPYFLDTLGWVHYRRGDYPVAATFLERAVSYAPDEEHFRYHLAMALMKSGQSERARQELTTALESGEEFEDIEEARATLRDLEAGLGEQRAAADR